MSEANNTQTEIRARLHYFVPGDIVLVVNHHVEDKLQTDKVRDAVINELTQIVIQLNKYLCIPPNGDWKGFLQLDPDRVLAFPVHMDDKSALPFRPSTTHLSLAFITTLPWVRPAVGRQIQTLQANTVALIELLNKSDVFQNSLPRPGVPVLRAVTPNWLMTPSTDHAGGGSPGSWPVAPPQDTLSRQPGTFEFDGAWADLNKCERGGEGVEVVILDTLPDLKRLLDFPASPSNWLLKQLQHGARDATQVPIPVGKFFALQSMVLPGVLTDPRSPLVVPGHTYRMSDHGLFIAGIVHTIVPGAKIRIIQVLNENGVGTLESIGNGFLKLDDERANGAQGPLIINCSLGMTMPRQGQSTKDLDDIWTLFSDKPLDPHKPEFGKLSLALESVCAVFEGPQMQIVAAAGNDGRKKQEQERPLAQYPAAFMSVIGVGALIPGDQTAEYSNLSDEPEFDGYATFGGDVDIPGTADPNNDPGDGEIRSANPAAGMLGVYIGAYPSASGPPVPSTSGWARWSGTSFAAPIISAAIACRVASEGSVAAAADSLKSAAEGDIGRIISVQQLP